MNHLKSIAVRNLSAWMAGVAFLLTWLPCEAQEAAASKEQVPPPWAFAVNPPDLKVAKDDGAVRHVPDSTLGLTLTQVRDSFFSPDWHPNDHPTMPEVVAKGRKPAVLACGFCHRAEGPGGPENASVAGLPAAYIIQQMADFKSGARQTSVPQRGPPKTMIAVAKAANPEEIEAAAAYFSSLKLKANIQVIETNMIPKTQIFGWHLADMKTGETEPIGERIVEVPEDLERFVSRDSHSKFIAYVPPGSILKGKMLANTGGGGVTVMCVVCHGPDLKGIATIPGIAGRSPSYIVRQLYDFKHGARAGVLSALMKPTVEHLKLEDMIALAAYAASLPP